MGAKGDDDGTNSKGYDFLLGFEIENPKLLLKSLGNC